MSRTALVWLTMLLGSLVFWAAVVWLVLDVVRRMLP